MSTGDPRPKLVEPTGNPRVDALIDAMVCPACRTIYNAQKANCSDLWHYDNHPEAKSLERAYARGITEGLRRADNALNWETSCTGCADRLDGLIAERAAGYEAGLAEGQAERDQLRRLHEATEAALEQAEQYARDLQDNLAVLDSRAEQHEVPRVVVHRCPPGNAALMPCCGRTPFEVPGDRMTTFPALVTCKAAEQPEGGPDA